MLAFARRLAGWLTVAFALSAMFAVGAGRAFAGPSSSQPEWAELTAHQREVLAPLANDWHTLEKQRKQKWLGIADRYAAMTPLEQQRVQKRMREWAALTPEQRKAARDRYKDLRNTPQPQKEALAQKWEEYRNLPDEEKRKLAASKAPKPLTPQTSGTRPAPIKKPVSSRSLAASASQTVSNPPTAPRHLSETSSTAPPVVQP